MPYIFIISIGPGGFGCENNLQKIISLNLKGSDLFCDSFLKVIHNLAAFADLGPQLSE